MTYTVVVILKSGVVFTLPYGPLDGHPHKEDLQSWFHTYGGITMSPSLQRLLKIPDSLCISVKRGTHPPIKVIPFPSLLYYTITSQ